MTKTAHDNRAMQRNLEGVARLPNLGVIRAQGEDAAPFLHGQLTQDFALLKPDEARLAALCTAKGRMLASFVAFPTLPSEILLVTSADLLPAMLKRLSMFVLRAKARLSDASGEYDVYGLAGEAAIAVRDRAQWAHLSDGEAHLVRLYPAEGVERALWIGPAGGPRPVGPELSPDAWLWGEVRSGIATITQPVSEAFVPQMLNYESVGGVNFKKGCYPGQEVVARSQFRGTLKRRAFIVHADAVLRAGQEVFHESDPTQPTGTVAQAAPSPDGGFDAIVSMQVSAAESGRLTAGSVDGPALSLLPLPYELLADI